MHSHLELPLREPVLSGGGYRSVEVAAHLPEMLINQWASGELEQVSKVDRA
jgi:hypothetical protein